MEEIIYKIDNWTIVKILGGTAVILTAVLAFFSNYFLTKIGQKGQHGLDKKIENLKGELSKQQSTYSSTIDNYFNNSQKILDKKIEAYNLLWTAIIDIKNNFPSGVTLFFQLFTDEEIKKENAYDFINSSPVLSPVLKSYHPENEMKNFLSSRDELKTYKPFLSDSSYKLFFTYNALCGRITHQFISDFTKKTIYNWKNDSHLTEILKITLTDKELNYIWGINIGSVPALIDLLEYKIIQDYRKNLDIKDNQEDTISYLKDIDKILSSK